MCGSDYKKRLIENLNDIKTCCALFGKHTQRSFVHRVTNGMTTGIKANVEQLRLIPCADNEYLKQQNARMMYQQHVSNTYLKQLVEDRNEDVADLKNLILNLFRDRQSTFSLQILDQIG